MKPIACWTLDESLTPDPFYGRIELSMVTKVASN